MELLSNKVTSDTLTAAEWNQPMEEIENVITALGQGLSNADLNQLGKGVAGYVAQSDFYTSSGPADNYVLSPQGTLQAPTQYFPGMRVRFVPNVNGTGGPVTVNVAGLGVRAVVREDGLPFTVAIEFNTAYQVELRFDFGANNFKIAGSLRDIATAVEVAAGVNNTKAVTPQELAVALSAISGSSRRVIKQVTQTKVNDAALADDNELVLSAIATGLWSFQASIFVTSNSTPDFKFRMSNIVLDSSFNYSYVIEGVAPSIAVTSTYKTNQDSVPLDNVVDFTAAQGKIIQLKGYLNVLALGNVAFQWAQNVSDPFTTRVLEGSWIELSRP